MTTLNINLSDELKARLEARAAESGFDRVEAYVESLLRADAQPGTGEDDLEQLLLERLASPGEIELSPAFVEQFKQQVNQRRQSREARS